MAGPMRCLQRVEYPSRVNITPIASASVGYAGVTAQARKLSEVEAVQAQRIGTGFAELDRVLGGGFVPGSVVLIGGDPGAGKSTLLLQASTALAQHQGVLYVTGEESLPVSYTHLTLPTRYRV